jgi:hypothetical protein
MICLVLYFFIRLFHILGGHRVHSLQYPPASFPYQRHHCSSFCISFISLLYLGLMYHDRDLFHSHNHTQLLHSHYMYILITSGRSQTITHKVRVAPETSYPMII